MIWRTLLLSIVNTENQNLLSVHLLRSDFLHFSFLPYHSGGRAARSASASLLSMSAKTPAAAIGTHGFVLSMFADCTAMAPLAPIFDYTVRA
jgi:hypothetical protein